MPHEWLPSRLPIIQAPMAGSQGVELCVASPRPAASARCPRAMLTPAPLREQIGAVRARTLAPFNVNFFCHVPPAPDPERDARWLAEPHRRTRRRASRRRMQDRPRTRAVRCGDGRGRRGDEACGGELPLRSAGSKRCSSESGHRGQDLFLGHHRRGSALARRARRRRRHRAGRGGRRPSRHVPVRRRRRPARAHRALCRTSSTRSLSRSSPPAGSPTAGASSRLSPLGAGAVQIGTAYLRTPQATISARASAGAGERARRRDADHQPLFRTAGARPSQPLHARAWADERRGRRPSRLRPGRSRRYAPITRAQGSADYSPLWVRPVGGAGAGRGRRRADRAALAGGQGGAHGAPARTLKPTTRPAPGH